MRSHSNASTLKAHRDGCERQPNCEEEPHGTTSCRTSVARTISRWASSSNQSISLGAEIGSSIGPVGIHAGRKRPVRAGRLFGASKTRLCELFTARCALVCWKDGGNLLIQLAVVLWWVSALLPVSPQLRGCTREAGWSANHSANLLRS